MGGSENVQTSGYTHMYVRTCCKLACMAQHHGSTHHLHQVRSHRNQTFQRHHE